MKNYLLNIMDGKICNICNIEKNISEFHLWKYGKDGYRYDCKECRKERTKEYRNKNKQKLLDYSKTYKQKNVSKIKIQNQIWRSNNPEYQNQYYIKKKSNELYRLKLNVRSRIRQFMKQRGYKKDSKTFEIIGCTPEELKIHLEKQFTDGMSWENYGYYGWHIDHRIPLDSGKSEEEIYKLCHYTNLQPLWWGDNLFKGKKMAENTPIYETL